MEKLIIKKKKSYKERKYIELTNREQEVLRSLQKNLPIQNIAEMLGIKAGTVRVHRSRIRKKQKDAKDFLRLLRIYSRVLRKE